MKDINLFNSLVTTVIPIGASFGAFTGGKITAIGRRKTIIILAVLFIVGSVLSLLLNFYSLIIGRLVIGYASGAISIAAPLFVSETTPPAISGSVGALNQIMVTLGIMVAN